MAKVVIRHCRTCKVYPARALRVAGLLRRDLKIEAETVPGEDGEFTVLVNDRIVAEKSNLRAPSDRAVVEAVRAAL